MKSVLKENSVVNLLVSLLVASFYVFEESTYGSFILLGITGLIFLVMIVEYQYTIPFKCSSFHLHILGMAAFCLFSAIWAMNSSYAVEKGITLVEILICLSVIYSYYSIKDDPVADLFNALMWAGFMVVIYSFVYYGRNLIMNVILGGMRLENGFSNVNSIGMITGIMIIIALYKYLYEKKFLYLLLGAPGIILILGTGSRKALLLTIIGFILLLIFRNLNRNIFKSIFKVTIIVVLVIIAIRWLSSFSIFAGINERLDGLFAMLTGNGVIDSSALLRQKYIKLGIDIFKENPILGIGMGNARLFTSSVYGHDAYLHNNYVELLADGGLVGFFIYYSIYSDLIKNIIKFFKYRDSRISLVITLIVIQLIMDYGNVSYYYKNTLFYFMILFLYVKGLKEKKIEIEFENGNS